MDRMTSSEILNRAFPTYEDDNPEPSPVLNGYVDIDGRCELFFDIVPPEVRRVIQKYAGDRHYPMLIADELLNLVEKYSRLDSGRLSTVSQEIIAEELADAEQYANVIETYNEFPRLVSGTIGGQEEGDSEDDEGQFIGEWGYVGWKMFEQDIVKGMRSPSNPFLRTVVSECRKLMADPSYDIRREGGPINEVMRHDTMIAALMELEHIDEGDIVVHVEVIPDDDASSDENIGQDEALGC